VAGRLTNPAVAWLLAKSDGAPAALRERAESYVAAVDGVDGIPETLAAGGFEALRRTINSGGDRSAALDLLAADALVTLALLAQAESDPVGLAAFAQHLRDEGVVRP
jgi:hypothetical protein